MSDTADSLLESRQYTVARREKEALLCRRLSELTEYHRGACPAYATALNRLWKDAPSPLLRLQDIPWLPVQLFSRQELRSIPAAAVFKVLTSAGTLGAATSRIFLDHESVELETRMLARTMGALLGGHRRPMIILDARQTDRRSFGACGAAMLGMSSFGSDHFNALDARLRLRRAELHSWLGVHAGEPLLLFGSTFMVWRHFLDALVPGEFDLRRAILLHGGGWEQLRSEAVGPRVFRERLADTTGLSRIARYHSTAEQIGTVFLECERGRLHAPNHADVLVRDPDSFDVQPAGTPGVIQVLSSLPTSYPGHSLLTEDLGTVVTRDGCGCGWLGAAIELHGRVPRSEPGEVSGARADTLAAAA